MRLLADGCPATVTARSSPIDERHAYKCDAGVSVCQLCKHPPVSDNLVNTTFAPNPPEDMPLYRDMDLGHLVG